MSWNILNYLVFSKINSSVVDYAYEGTKTVAFWSGGKILYLITPSVVYNWVCPRQSETQKLLEELRMVKEELRLLNMKYQQPISEEPTVFIEGECNGVIRTKIKKI